MRHARCTQAIVVAMIAMLFGLAASTAAADPRYGVMNAPEGVYWR